MNTPIAENRFTLTKPLFTEGMLRVWADGSGKTVKKLMAVLVLVWLVLAGYTLWQGGSMAMPLTELLILALVIVWAIVWLPRSKAKQAFRAMEGRGMAGVERSVCFYEEHLEVDVAGNHKTLDYADITQILQGKNLLILVGADKSGVLVKKDAWTSGTETEVLNLIRQAKEEEHSND